ncbi:MAG: hypothetical protein LBF22_01560 [Deltaproteobacteria bacterium]|nr:hypothetical protein [Deltaproteobacteria bacterium]
METDDKTTQSSEAREDCEYDGRNSEQKKENISKGYEIGMIRAIVEARANTAAAQAEAIKANENMLRTALKLLDTCIPLDEVLSLTKLTIWEEESLKDEHPNKDKE